MIHHVAHREHTAIAVPDNHRIGLPARRQPSGGQTVVFDGLVRALQGTALGGAAIAYGQNVMPASIKRETEQTKLGQQRRQETRRTSVKIHRVTVKQQHRTGNRTALRLIQGAVQRRGVGGDAGGNACVLGSQRT